MKTDQFGRTWHYTHPYTQPLQLDPKLAATAFNADRALRGSAMTYADYEEDYGKLEPYLIRDLTGDLVMGMRYGDKPHEYISPMLDSRIASMLFERHCAIASPKEQRVIAIIKL